MSKPLLIVLGIITLALFAVQPAVADDMPGVSLFDTYCRSCHGAAGQGGFASAIGTKQYLTSHNDVEIFQVTGDGIKDTKMPAWSKAKGGKLTDEQIADIVAYLRSLLPTSPTPTNPTPTVTVTPTPVIVFSMTKMTVNQSFNDDNKAVLNAQLLKSDGTAVVGAPIVFERSTTFGTLNLGTVKTDKSGTASLEIPQVPASARSVDVHFKGDSNLGSSLANIVLQPAPVSSVSNGNTGNVRLSVDDKPLLKPEGSLITPNPPLVPTLLFVSVVLGVWLIYGYVIVQIIRIRISKPGTQRENKPTSRVR